MTDHTPHPAQDAVLAALHDATAGHLYVPALSDTERGHGLTESTVLAAMVAVHDGTGCDADGITFDSLDQVMTPCERCERAARVAALTALVLSRPKPLPEPDVTYAREWGYRMDDVPALHRHRDAQPGHVSVIPSVSDHAPDDSARRRAREWADRWQKMTGGRATVVSRTVRTAVQRGPWDTAE